MSGYTLKIIAIVTMLIDHMTAILISPNHSFYLIGRSVGRLAFPIFCFLIVEGLLHTRNIQKYMARLFIFALLSELPFDFAFYNPRLNDNYRYHQNIYFTLFIGLIVIALIHYINKNNFNYWTRLVVNTMVLFLGCLLAYFLHTDYSYMGVLMIWAFYTFRAQLLPLTIALLLINALYGFPQILAVFSLLITRRYNGERGPHRNKYIFYGFYPVHLLILAFIKSFIL